MKNTYIIEAANPTLRNYRIIASFSSESDEKAIQVYCKFRQNEDLKFRDPQIMILRKFTNSQREYLEGVEVLNLEVLMWGSEELAEIYEDFKIKTPVCANSNIEERTA